MESGALRRRADRWNTVGTMGSGVCGSPVGEPAHGFMGDSAQMRDLKCGMRGNKVSAGTIFAAPKRPMKVGRGYSSGA